MLYLIVLLAGLSVGLLVFMAMQLRPTRSEVAVRERLAEMDQVLENPFGNIARRRRQKQRERYEELVRELGEWVVEHRDDTGDVAKRLVMAGFRAAKAEPVFWGVRIVVALSMPVVFFFAASLLGYGFVGSGLAAAFGAGAGWILPSFHLDHRIRKRQAEIRRTLPDALDLLVVCVEAGMGLNQAVTRVADEIRNVSLLMSEELSLVNLEIRAGAARDVALRNLATRTGVDDVNSIVAMLIQSDRFGTSIGTALRSSSDAQRVRRAQEAEEIAAKMPVKMLFPLAVCIFPAIIMVILGPAVLAIMKAFGMN